MSKTTAALMLMIVLAIGYFLYQWLVHSPCDTVLQQTAPELKGNIKVIKAEGGVALSQPQVQELSEASQKLAVYLKTCCVLAQMGKVDAERCLAKASEYDRHITEVATNLKEAKAAQEQSNPELAQEKKEKVQQAASNASRAEKELAEIVKEKIPSSPTVTVVPTQTPIVAGITPLVTPNPTHGPSPIPASTATAAIAPSPTPTPTSTHAPTPAPTAIAAVSVAPSPTPSPSPSLTGTTSGERRIIGGIPFHWCAAGEFYDREGHRIQIRSGFWIAETELTRGQWSSVMGGSVTGSPNLPKTRVSWFDARRWCQTITRKDYLPMGWHFDLPSEAQWEYACRAGTRTKYFFGDDQRDLQKYAVYGKSAESGNAEPVGRKQPNRWGLHDMYGNVWEWCRDRAGSAGEFILRGGGWADSDADYPPGYADDGTNSQSNSVGFRPVIVQE